MVTNIADAVPRLKRLIPRLRGKRIGVLGDLMLDRLPLGHGLAALAGSGRSRGRFRRAERMPGRRGQRRGKHRYARRARGSVWSYRQ